jgi:hypothetical protein
VARRMTLERGGGSPEGFGGRELDGLLRLFGSWSLLFPGP